MSDHAYVVPPNWPQPPAGWVPPPGWTPDPGWPPAPPGWKFWRPVAAGSCAGGERRNLEAEVAAMRLVMAGTREENDRLRQERAALRAETERLNAAVEAANAELRRLLGIG